MAPTQKPGELPIQPGEYEECGPNGGHLSNPKRIITQPGGPPLPPTQAPGRKWRYNGPRKS